ncbi:MAG: hypothetical protein OES09_09655 [Gammaproteobacteria bacterium]|nr:hypothetical protein [Gammaproteobacteria bacterium]
MKRIAFSNNSSTGVGFSCRTTIGDASPPKRKHSGDAFGYDRLQGALANLGHTVSSSTVANILKRHGIEPAPERGKRTSRRTFLKAHWDVMAATDLFTIEGWTPNGLVTYYVLFIIHLATRKISIADATPNPTVLS